MSSSITRDQEQRAREIASAEHGDPFYVSDCEGNLQVWRESALTHVARDETGAINMYSLPYSYRPTDQVIEIDLDSWDPGEDATDDQRRTDINDLVDARALISPLLAEIDQLNHQLDSVPDRSRVAGRLHAALDELAGDRMWAVLQEPENRKFLARSLANATLLKAEPPHDSEGGESGE